jgi:hypothetical protein
VNSFDFLFKKGKLAEQNVSPFRTCSGIHLRLWVTLVTWPLHSPCAVRPFGSAIYFRADLPEGHTGDMETTKRVWVMKRTSGSVKYRIAAWAIVGSCVGGFWALYFFPTAPVPINSAEPIWTLVRLIIPLRFLSSCPLSLWLVLVANAADRGKPDSQQPTSRNSGPAQPRNQQVEESLSINSHSDSCIGVK